MQPGSGETYFAILIFSNTFASILSSPGGTVGYQFMFAITSGVKLLVKLARISGFMNSVAPNEAVPYFSLLVKTAAFSGRSEKFIHL